MSRWRMVLLTVAAPAAYILLLEYVRHRWLEERVGWNTAHLAVMAGIVVGSYAFSTIITGILDRAHREKQELEEGLAILTERERIAREMHDGFAQKLAFLNLKLGAAEDRVRRAGGVAVADLQELRRVVQEAYADVRFVLFDLKVELRPGERVLSALSRYLQDFHRQTGIRVELTMDCDPDRVRLSPVAEVQLLRIVQEALTNVRKHAAASTVWVEVRCPSRDRAEVTIRDDGRGFDPTAAGGGAVPHFGLDIMADRAREAGGEVVVESAPGQGATVRVRLPCEHLAQEGEVTWTPSAS